MARKSQTPTLQFGEFVFATFVLVDFFYQGQRDLLVDVNGENAWIFEWRIFMWLRKYGTFGGKNSLEVSRL